MNIIQFSMTSASPKEISNQKSKLSASNIPITIKLSTSN